MQKEINFYQEMASEHRLQENGRGPVPLSSLIWYLRTRCTSAASKIREEFNYWSFNEIIKKIILHITGLKQDFSVIVEATGGK